MKAALADRLLAEVMQWTPENVARERPDLGAMATLKYDDYQQYSPGLRFVESLALWLAQFDCTRERQIAFDYVKTHLVFVSSQEMEHLASIAYPDFIRPRLVDLAARAEGIPSYHLRTALECTTFRTLEKCTLFCGLTDGAKIDFFRRSNPTLSHEQIFQSYDLSDDKIREIGDRFSEEGDAPPCKALVLLDDFSASGRSYIRLEDSVYKGKVARILRKAGQNEAWRHLVQFPQTKVIVVVYAATDVAIENIRTGAAELLGENYGCFEIQVAQRLRKEICTSSDDTAPFVALADKYYDSCLEDESTEKGGTDLKFGFAGGGLPLVLAHNAPNNSLFLLWAGEPSSVRGLFPRVSRHRTER